MAAVRSTLFLKRSKTYFFKASVQDRLQEAFWIDFGDILGGFGKVLGRIWTNFGMDLRRVGGRICRNVDDFEKSWGRVSK